MQIQEHSQHQINPSKITHIGFMSPDLEIESNPIGNIVWNNVQKYKEYDHQNLRKVELIISLCDLDIILNNEVSQRMFFLQNNQIFFTEILAINEKNLKSSNNNGLMDILEYNMFRSLQVYSINDKRQKLDFFIYFNEPIATESFKEHPSYAPNMYWDCLMTSFKNIKDNNDSLECEFFPKSIIDTNHHKGNYYFPTNYTVKFEDDKDPELL